MRSSIRWFCMLIAGLSGSALSASAADPALGDLHWRSIGPHRAGWSTVAVGVPGAPNVYYFGAAGGGVWKTTDAGHNWFSIFDSHAPSIGALAVAASDSKVIYVGTGQPQARYDTAAGDGVYVSRDAGASWAHLGLSETRHIGDLLVHPGNAEILLVAALGPYYADSSQRGVFRSTDGGAHWKKTLFVDESTGVVDLASDVKNPDVVYASAWTARNYPWMSYFTPMVGAGSGLYKSVDGGQHWTRLNGKGWPAAALGRIGVATRMVGSQSRVYAIVDHAEQGGLYRSDDGGANWQVMQKDPGLTSRYFSRVIVHPDDADTLYLMGRSIKVSHDGGKTLKVLRGSPGGDDYHDLWLNPDNPENMIAASDQGTVVTLNGGTSWSNWYNQATGQFYCLHVDERFPYRLYAGQQDNGSVSIASRSDYGAISFRDWMPTGADERDCVLADPDDRNIVYGSGLGGRVSRFDARTGDVQNITPVPINTYGRDPRTIDHRWSWITPFTLSSTASHALYLGSQYLFRSDDRGAHWSIISPDLTGQTRDASQCQGTVPEHDARACGFGVIFTIAPSPHDEQEIWVGTDSGLVQHTSDGGKTWHNRTPRQLPAWSTVARIDISPVHRNHIYLAVDQHRRNVFAPMLFRSHDSGVTWQRIDAGIPANEFTAVIRADWQQAGLLFAGTDRGMYFSLDDGGHWNSLQLNLPVAWVRDLRVVGNDLAIATQGRALWILDNFSRLRELARTGLGGAPRLFAVADAMRLRKNQNKDTPLAAEIPLGENPVTGAMIEYHLPRDAEHVGLKIFDGQQQLVRSFSSDDPPEKLTADQYFSDLYRKPPANLPRRAGLHRWVWNLRYPRPLASAYEYSIAATAGVETSALPEGALALPGDYRIVMTVDGQSLESDLRIIADPRVALPIADMRTILDFNLALARALKTVAERSKVAEQELASLKTTDTPAAAARTAQLNTLLDGPGPRGLRTWMAYLSALAVDAESAERIPTAAQREMLREAERALEAL